MTTEQIKSPTPAAAPQREAQRPAAKPTAAQQRRASKASAIWDREMFVASRGTVERLTALGVLFLSFVGSAVALAGGWSAVLVADKDGAWGIAWNARMLLGVVLQAALTWAQLALPRPAANASRSADAFLTALGYGPLAWPALLWLVEVVWPWPAATWATPWGAVTNVQAMTALIIYGLAYVPAKWPESRLVRDGKER